MNSENIDASPIGHGVISRYAGESENLVEGVENGHQQ
jgi:hypothetical protein